jgi:hypothetical protein
VLASSEISRPTSKSTDEEPLTGGDFLIDESQPVGNALVFNSKCPI